MCKYFHKIFPYSWATAKILQSDNHSCILLHYINYFSFIWATVKIPPQQSHNHLFFHILYIFCRIQDIWATTTMSHQPTGNYFFFHIVYFLCSIFQDIWAITTTPPQQSDNHFFFHIIYFLCRIFQENWATTTTPPQQSDRAKTLRRLLRRLPWTQRPPRGWCRNCKKCKCIIMQNIEHNIAINWSLTIREAVKKNWYFLGKIPKPVDPPPPQYILE